MKKNNVKYRQELVDRNIILSVRHLKQFFRLGDVYNKAVHDVSFDVAKGECVGLVGESGCGKTTTGRSIIRLYDITSGSIYFKGYRISAGSRWNEKEIKYTKLRTREQIRNLKHEEHEELQELADPSRDDAKEVAAEIRDRYEKKISELKHHQKQVIAEQREKIRQIRYDNRHVDPDLMSKIQMIFQDPIDSLDPRMTVEDIINEGLVIQGHRNREENARIVAEMLEKVGLVAEHASRYPHEFSGGQRQRIGIARALVMQPELLICDEPISALDVSIRAQVINLLNDLKEEYGLTLLFIAHDLSVVKYFCDRIAVMYFGEIVEMASSDELFLHPLHPYTKALLSAIPKPNPLTEKNRKRIVYDPSLAHDYSQEKPRLCEILPGHVVLANEVELARYQEEIKSIDGKRRKKRAKAS